MATIHLHPEHPSMTNDAAGFAVLTVSRAELLILANALVEHQLMATDFAVTTDEPNASEWRAVWSRAYHLERMIEKATA